MRKVVKLDDLPILPSTRFREENYCCKVGKYFCVTPDSFYNGKRIDEVRWPREILIGVTHNAPIEGHIGKTAILVQDDDDEFPIWFHIRDWRVHKTMWESIHAQYAWLRRK